MTEASRRLLPVVAGTDARSGGRPERTYAVHRSSARNVARRQQNDLAHSPRHSLLQRQNAVPRQHVDHVQTAFRAMERRARLLLRAAAAILPVRHGILRGRQRDDGQAARMDRRGTRTIPADDRLLRTAANLCHRGGMLQEASRRSQVRTFSGMVPAQNIYLVCNRGIDELLFSPRLACEVAAGFAMLSGLYHAFRKLKERQPGVVRLNVPLPLNGRLYAHGTPKHSVPSKCGVEWKPNIKENGNEHSKV